MPAQRLNKLMSISIVTIVKNRHTAIVNMILGINQGLALPAELLIVHMNEEPYQLPKSAYSIRQINLKTAEKLPLAKARNYAMTHARFEEVIFLDADCIPGPELVETYKKAFADETDALFSGRVAYLSPTAMAAPNLLENLNSSATKDPVRGQIDQYPYELFWSLNFACTKSTFHIIGGFDEEFTGYGAEDTDFGFLARRENVSIQTIDAFAFHQPHPSYSPPLNHLKDIISNASRFYVKWGTWPMEGWLKKFADAGLITFNENKIELIRLPEEEELSKALKPF